MFWNSEWVGNTALDSCKAGFLPFPCFLVVHVSLSSGFVTQFTRTSEDNLTTSYKRHCMETYVCPGGWRMEAVNIYSAFVIERMFGIQAITKKGVIESVVLLLRVREVASKSGRGHGPSWLTLFVVFLIVSYTGVVPSQTLRNNHTIQCGVM